jgi:hypothetical protein
MTLAGLATVVVRFDGEQRETAKRARITVVA